MKKCKTETACGSCNWDAQRLYCVDFEMPKSPDKPKLCANCFLNYLWSEDIRIVFPSLAEKVSPRKQ